MTSVRRGSKFCKHPYIVIYKQPLTSFEQVNKNNTKKAFLAPVLALLQAQHSLSDRNVIPINTTSFVDLRTLLYIFLLTNLVVTSLTYI